MARPSNPARIYVDSNALIIGILKRPGYEPVQELLHLAQIGRIELYISALSYVEVRGFPVS